MPWTTICGFGGGGVSLALMLVRGLDLEIVKDVGFGDAAEAPGFGTYVPMLIRGACHANVAVPAPAEIMSTSWATTCRILR